jgi:hypothetical protein
VLVPDFRPSGFVARLSVKFHSMARRATCLIHFVIAICLRSNAAGAGDTQFKKTPFGTGAEVGFGIVTYHNTCVWFWVFFALEDFFKDLHQHKTPNGVEFRKKKEKTEKTKKTIDVNFPDQLPRTNCPGPTAPDQLLVDVEAYPQKCSAEMTPPDYAAGLVAGPAFDLAWKRGEETRPVILLATQEHHNPLDCRWSYFLTVPSATVPLTDCLVIDVSLRNGLCRTHLTASLDSRLRNSVPVPSTGDLKE